MGTQPGLSDHRVATATEAQIERIQATTEAARVAIDEVSSIASYAEWKISTTLRAVQMAKDAPVSKEMADEQAARQSRKDEYLARVQQIVSAATGSIAHIIEQRPANGEKHDGGV